MSTRSTDRRAGADGEAKRRSAPASRCPTRAALPIDGKQLGDWVLPPIALLKQAGQQAVNMTEIERRGMTLQESLASHGVETQLVGMTVGPTVTRD